MYVSDRFERLDANLQLTPRQLQDGFGAAGSVIKCLYKHYYDGTSARAVADLIGSWGKGLQVRPPRDVDLLFLIPVDIYHRLEQRTTNKQTGLLQEARNILLRRFPNTEVHSDEQAVVVPFERTNVEVIPAFSLQNGRFFIPDARFGGRYIVSDLRAELEALNQSDLRNKGVTRRLIRMIKQWQRVCNVPLKSYLVERLVIEFLDQWYDDFRTFYWFDWMIRDFFDFIISRANGHVVMPGTLELRPLGDKWRTRAQTAFRNARQACDYERNKENMLAGLAWSDIFGREIPTVAEYGM